MLTISGLIGVAISTVQDVPFVNREVARFTDTTPAAPSAYQATIDWGDGSSSAGSVTQDAVAVFHVAGGHDYTLSGSFPISVTVVGPTSTATLAFYAQNKLVSNVPGAAAHVDPNLVSPWGLATSPDGAGPWWVSNNGTGTSTLYDGSGTPQPLVVTMPLNQPAAIAFNPFAASDPTDFVIKSGAQSGPANFFFANQSDIEGWNPDVPLPSPSTSAQSTGAAIYYYFHGFPLPAPMYIQGLAVGSSGGNNYLYAVNKYARDVEVFNGGFGSVSLAGSFHDPNLDPAFAPSGIANIDGQLYVTYALDGVDIDNHVYGPGNGLIDVFATDGTFIKRLATGGTLNAPWSLAKAPADFGIFSNALLVGNTGDGRINAFDTSTGQFLGQIQDSTGQAISGLHSIAFGTGGGGSGATNSLYFTGQLSGGQGSLLGNLVYLSDSGAALATVITQPTVSATEGVLFSGPVAAFPALSPSDTASAYRVSIDWGDGSIPSVGTVTPGNAASGGTYFVVSGSHVYADSLPASMTGILPPGLHDGTYPTTVFITDLGTGTGLDVSNPAAVADRALTVQGEYNSLLPFQNVQEGGQTIRQYNFIGTTSEPLASVQIYSQPPIFTAPYLLGQTVSDALGNWSFSTTAGLGGGQTIVAVAKDQFGHTQSDPTTLFYPPVITDEAGPKITDVVFDRLHGRIQFSIMDVGSPYNLGSAGIVTDPAIGLLITPLMDASNYSLTRPGAGPGFFKVTKVTVTPGTSLGPQTVTLVINGGRPLAGGRYTFLVRSAGPGKPSGVQDFFGNGLDGEYYGFLPSGNNVAGGDFVASVVAVHHRYSVKTLIGTASPVDPPGTPAMNHKIVPTRAARPTKIVSQSRPKAHQPLARRITTHLATKPSAHPEGPARLLTRSPTVPLE